MLSIPVNRKRRWRMQESLMTSQPNVLANQDPRSEAPVRPDPATIEWIEMRVEALAREQAAAAIEYDSWQATLREQARTRR